jgi:hypothetical protein
MQNINPYGNYMGMNYNPGTYGQNFNNYSGNVTANQNNGINWVQGLEGAKAYQLSPNSNIILLDSEQDRFYIKTSDNIGMCSLRTFDFTEVTDVSKKLSPDNKEIDMSKYVTKEELNAALSKIKGGKYNGKQFVQSNDSTNN